MSTINLTAGNAAPPRRLAMPPALVWQRHIIPPPRDVTAIVMGDPPPGRSALDRRQERQHQQGQKKET